MAKVTALKVFQWLTEWDEAVFDPIPPRGKPEPHFYLFTMSAYELKRLTGIYRRSAHLAPAEDTGIQRRHDPDRSAEILRYLQDGFPLSRIDRRKLVDQSEVRSLRMPGWIPSSVLVNILTQSDERGPKGSKVAPTDLVTVHERNQSSVELELPAEFLSNEWAPSVHPIEVIDGQHRLWALEEPESGSYWTPEFREKIRGLQIPVVAFHGLDATWRAYLFYTINQLPKKIDSSMVFDLYPLLRTQEWLLRFEGPNIYRQTRAQDLTILLWSHPESPWKGRIRRLGGRVKGEVTQASFINSLMASFIKSYRGKSRTILGGIFGTPRGTHEAQIGWTREQQAAFLIMAWQEVENAITRTTANWANTLLQRHTDRKALFSGPDTLIATDQGVRGFLNVLNDLVWIAQNQELIDLNAWGWERREQHDDNQAISAALLEIRQALPTLADLVQKIASGLANFDWRLPSSLSENDAQYPQQASYRGSSGYRILRRALLLHLKNNSEAPIDDLAQAVIEALKYETEEEE